MARKRGYQVYLPGGATDSYYLRFRHEGRRFNVSLRTGIPGDAEKAAARIYAEAISGQWQPARTVIPSAPLEGMVANWLGSSRGPGGLDPQTLKTYASYGRRWCRRDGWAHVSDLTSAECKAFLRERLGDVTRSSVRKEAGALRGFLRWCKEQDLLREVPEVSLPARAPGTRQKERRAVVLSPEEVAALLTHLPEWSLRPTRTGAAFPVRAYVEFLYETGLRASTVERLVRGKAWDRGWKHLVLDDDQDKARFGRTVPLSRRAVELLEAHAPPREAPLWGRYRVDALFRRAARASGLDADRASRVVPYDLRHSRLTHLSEAGATRGGLQLIAGHKAATTTDHYLQPRERAAREALDAVDVAARASDVTYGSTSCRTVIRRCHGGARGTSFGTSRSGNGALARGAERLALPVIPGTCAQGGT